MGISRERGGPKRDYEARAGMGPMSYERRRQLREASYKEYRTHITRERTAREKANAAKRRKAKTRRAPKKSKGRRTRR